MTNPSFDALPLSEETLTSIREAGYESPTEVQWRAVPVLMEGKDAILQAQTGTGKTAAFVLPAVERIEIEPGKVSALVLTPTRELALQVSREFAKLGKTRGVDATAIFGGTSFQKQFDALETAQVVVATPGRLLDLLRRKKINLSGVKYFGLDEADEMLSMGFEREVMDVISHLPKIKQSFLCSATYNEAIKRVASNFINEPEIVDCSSDAIGAQSVEHLYFQVTASTKRDALMRLIATGANTGAIIFANTRAATFRIHETLSRSGLRVDVLNGDLAQSEREKALGRMREGNVDFLVATDVAARGIDISGLPSVINYDMPESPDVYVHRTGRTGRAGQAGIAFSLVTPRNVSVFHQLQKFFKLTLKRIELPTDEEVKNQLADRLLDDALDGLDANGDLAYAEFMPVARRLGAREDGARIIAKLIAHYRASASSQPQADDAAHADADILPRLDDIAQDTPASVDAPAEAEGAHGTEAGDEPTADGDDQTEAAHAPDSTTDEAKPKRARSRRKGSSGPEASAEEPAQTVEPDTEAAVEPTLTLGAIIDWFVARRNSPSKARFQSSGRIAKDLGASPEEVDALAESDDRIERSRGRRPMWRLTKDFAFEVDRRLRNESEPEIPAEALERVLPVEDSFQRLRLNVGADIVTDAETMATELVEMAGLDREDVGAVQVLDGHSLLDVNDAYWQDFVAALSGESYRGTKLNIEPARAS